MDEEQEAKHFAGLEREVQSRKEASKGAYGPIPKGATIIGHSEYERSVAMEAYRLVHGERRRAYGPVEKSFNNIATLASIVLDHPFTGKDVAKFMLCVKLCREAAAHGRDNLVDLCGYADLLQQLYDADRSDAKEATQSP